MTVYQARQILSGPLLFGDTRQIEALKIILDQKNVTPEQLMDYIDETGEAPI